MIKKVLLTSVYRTEKDKKGNPLKTKDGKPYTRVLIKSEEYGDQLISGFGGDWNKDWKEGEEVTIEITEVKKDDKTFLNFGKVNMTDRLMEMIQELNKRVMALEKAQKEKVAKENFKENYGMGYPDMGYDDAPPITEADL